MICQTPDYVCLYAFTSAQIGARVCVIVYVHCFNVVMSISSGRAPSTWNSLPFSTFTGIQSVNILVTSATYIFEYFHWGRLTFFLRDFH